MDRLRITNRDGDKVAEHIDIRIDQALVDDSRTIHDVMHARREADGIWLGGIVLSNPIRAHGVRPTSYGFETTGVAINEDGTPVDRSDRWQRWEVTF